MRTLTPLIVAALLVACGGDATTKVTSEPDTAVVAETTVGTDGGVDVDVDVDVDVEGDADADAEADVAEVADTDVDADEDVAETETAEPETVVSETIEDTEVVDDDTTEACEAGQALTPAGACKTCSGTCDKPGHTGQWWHRTDSGGRCLCETQDGWYLETTLSVLPQPCDEDGDGWVREAARSYVDFDSEPEIQANARCAVRTIDRVTLRNEWKQDYVVKLCDTGKPVGEGETCTTVGLALYEATDLDEPVAPADEVRFPTYAGDGAARALTGAELNPLTKACVTAKGDFNDNGIADIEEAAEMEVPAGISLDNTQLWLLSFGYFVELHRGYYEGTGDVGSYVVEERSRCTGDDFFLGYDEASGSDYWRECSRNRARAFNRNAIEPGFDFARWMCSASSGTCPMPDAPTTVTPVDAAPPHGLCEVTLPPADGTWRGMTHHSQFKCVEVVAAAADVDEAWQEPVASFYDRALAPGGSLQMNDCGAAGAEDGQAQPDAPVLACDQVAPPSGTVGFAAVRYADEVSEGAYQAGCIDEWLTWPELCPGYDADLPEDEQTTVGDGLSNEFGDVVCGCGENYGGLACDVGCPTSDNMRSADYSVTPRQGYWLCGDVRGSACVEDSGFEPVDFEDFGAWTVSGLASFLDSAALGVRLRLTTDSANASGAAWHLTKVRVADGFTARFAFELASSGFGADGFAFVVHDTSTTAVGNESGLTTRALNVGFDSFGANGSSTGSKIVRVSQSGAVVHEVDLGGDWTNSGRHTVAITLRGGALDVVIDEVVVIDGVSVSLADAGAMDDAGMAWVGFTARNGALSELRTLTDFRMDGLPVACGSDVAHEVTDADGAVWTLSGGLSAGGISGAALREDTNELCEALGLDPTATGDDPLVCGTTPSCGGFETYANAVARCTAANMRLCTEDELMNGETAGTGCNYESTLTWTSTACETGKYFVGPGSGLAVPGQLPECHAPTGATAVARCCAGAVPSTNGWVLR